MPTSVKNFAAWCLLTSLAALPAACNNDSAPIGPPPSTIATASGFSGDVKPVTIDTIDDSYTSIAVSIGGEASVQGLRKVKMNNLCRLIEKASDNSIVNLKPSKWRLTHSFYEGNIDAMNYFCDKYANMGELLDAINLDPRDVKKADLIDSIAAVAEVLNGATISAGPKKPLAIKAPPGTCDVQTATSNPAAPTTAQTNAATAKIANGGMYTCAPTFVVALLLLDKDTSVINNNMVASGLACMAMYADILKSAKIPLPAKSDRDTAIANCQAIAAAAATKAADDAPAPGPAINPNTGAFAVPGTF